MIEEEFLDLYFNSFMQNVKDWLPDGFIDVNLNTLHQHNLLHFNEHDHFQDLTHYFHLIESDEKLTLFNDRFIIWIVPDANVEFPTTYTLIAIINEDSVHLEVGFKTTGVYNTSKFLMHFLEYYLDEILENEETINRLK